MSEAADNCGSPDSSDPSIDEQLVAYLDGELDAESSRRIEELLSTDPRLRQTLQRLDRTWELLDELDTSGAPDRFTQTTLEMVTVAASEDARRSLAGVSRQRRWRWAIVGGSLLAAGLAGFLAVAYLAPDPNRQLVKDLPLLMNEDLSLLVNYKQDDLQFLQMLSQAGLFVEENGDERHKAATGGRAQ